MIGTEVRIAAKLYRVNVKNGKGLREKFTSVRSLSLFDPLEPRCPHGRKREVHFADPPCGEGFFLSLSP